MGRTGGSLGVGAGFSARQFVFLGLGVAARSRFAREWVWQRAGDMRPPPGLTPCAERAADKVSTICHDAQAHPRFFLEIFRETDAVIGNGQDALVLRRVEADVDVPGLAVANGVGDRLLGDVV